MFALLHRLHLIFTSVVNIKIPPPNDSYLNLLDYQLTFVHHNVSVYSLVFVNVMFFNAMVRISRDVRIFTGWQL